MNKTFVFLVILLSSAAVRASWYWPFGSDEKDPPRLSELMEPASLLIDEASDLAGDGKISEAVEKYRAALSELDRVEAENPDRVERPEFATLKTKRAYVSAAIDSLLLNQARDNAKSVAVSDTTELERKLAEERSGKKEPQAEGPVEGSGQGEGIEKAPDAEDVPVQPKKVVRKKVRKAAKRAAPRPLTRAETVMKAIAEKDFATADRIIAELLEEKPNNAAALNLRAARESAAGDFKAAEKTLDQAIQSNPRDYYAYYNMAQLYLQVNPDNKSGARRYYETARAYGCPEDAELEAALK